MKQNFCLKLAFAAMVFVLLVSLTGCDVAIKAGGSPFFPKTGKDSPFKDEEIEGEPEFDFPENPPNTENMDALAENIILTDYGYSLDQLVFIWKNGNDTVLPGVNITTAYLDGKGKIISFEESSVGAAEPNAFFVTFSYPPYDRNGEAVDFKTFEHDFKVMEKGEWGGESIASMVSIEDNEGSDSVIIKATNNSSVELFSCTVAVVYFKNDKIIYAGLDGISNVGVGKSGLMKVNYPYGDEFDSYSVILNEATGFFP